MFHLVRCGGLAQTIFALWEFGSRSNQIDDPWCRVNYFDRRITAVKNSLELKVSFWLWLEYKHCKNMGGTGRCLGVQTKQCSMQMISTLDYLMGDERKQLEREREHIIEHSTPTFNHQVITPEELVNALYQLFQCEESIII